MVCRIYRSFPKNNGTKRVTATNSSSARFALFYFAKRTRPLSFGFQVEKQSDNLRKVKTGEPEKENKK